MDNGYFHQCWTHVGRLICQTQNAGIFLVNISCKIVLFISYLYICIKSFTSKVLSVYVSCQYQLVWLVCELIIYSCYTDISISINA